jgi:hypothetical protein
MFDKLKNMFKKAEPLTPIPAEAVKQLKKDRAKKAEPPVKSAKELATEAGEPYVAMLGMDIDPENIHSGSFELDWNDKFLANLIRAGYVGKTDADIVECVRFATGVHQGSREEVMRKAREINQKRRALS